MKEERGKQVPSFLGHMLAFPFLDPLALSDLNFRLCVAYLSVEQSLFSNLFLF